MCVCAYTYMCAYVFIYMYNCIYLFIYVLDHYLVYPSPSKTTRIYKDRIVIWYLASVIALRILAPLSLGYKYKINNVVI